MSSPSAGTNQENLICRVCQHRGSDVQFMGCGCTLHARCVPLSLIIGEGNPQQPPPEGVPPPVQCTSQPCMVCNEGVITGMYLLPLSLSLLDRAVEQRKKIARAAAQASNAAGNINPNGKRQRDLDNDFHEVQAESSYLLLSHTRSSLTSTMSMETDLHRTGRWTSEEIAFVDFLLNTFDRSMLTLPHGIKLNEFLGDVLMCKSSRLTKKMKNARLSTRSYVLRPPMPHSERLDTVMMSRLQEKFLQSLSNESTQLELLFNLTKLWRTHFSNLCLQVGYSSLEAADWVASLEAMERRAAEAEEMIRKARRKRMGLALRTDARASNPGVFFGNKPVEGRPAASQVVPNEAKSVPQLFDTDISTNMFDNEKSTVASDEASDADFISNMLEFSSQPGPDGKRNRLLSIDLDPGSLDDLFEHEELAGPKPCKPFDYDQLLRELIAFLEKNHLPFVHVDLWVPSLLPESSHQVRLFNAGYATREDVSPVVTAQFNEFGEYSKKFSFASGVGLPGRIFECSKPSWFARVDQADPKIFERTGGAKVYGVKTVLGLPLTSNIGKIVVAMYTMSEIQRNEAVIDKCVAAFSNYSPEPKWRLVVEMGNKGQGQSSAGDSTVSSDTAAMNEPDIDFSTCFDGEDFSGLTTYSEKPAATTTNASESRASGAEGMASNAAEEEQKIATLLGEYMPLSNSARSSAGEPSVSATVSPDLLNEFMQLRLLLLRPRSRRSAADNELIDVLRKSFHGYSNGNRRSGSELATLLVNDWCFLSGASPPSQAPPTKSDPTPASPGQGMMTSGMPSLSNFHGRRSSQSSDGQHQCHVMDVPRFNTGGPAKRPSSVALNQPMLTSNTGRPESRRNSSFDSVPQSQSHRRISVSSEVPDSPHSNQNKQVNVVNP